MLYSVFYFGPPAANLRILKSAYSRLISPISFKNVFVIAIILSSPKNSPSLMGGGRFDRCFKNNESVSAYKRLHEGSSL